MSEEANKDRISEAFLLIAKLAEVMGVRSIKDLPGLWVHKVDECWTVKVNGHLQETDGVPPYHALLEFNDMPAGVLNPYGGSMISVTGINEDAFIEAMLAAIAKAGANHG